MSYWTTAAPTKHADVKKWLRKNPRVKLHFTPTSGNWMNTAEVLPQL